MFKNIKHFYYKHIHCNHDYVYNYSQITYLKNCNNLNKKEFAGFNIEYFICTKCHKIVETNENLIKFTVRSKDENNK